MDEALRNAADAAVEWASIGRGRLPRPRSLEALLEDDDVRNALAEGASLVVVPMVRDANRPAKAERLAGRGAA